jgi:hypothetical protein
MLAPLTAASVLAAVLVTWPSSRVALPMLPAACTCPTGSDHTGLLNQPSIDLRLLYPWPLDMS